MPSELKLLGFNVLQEGVTKAVKADIHPSGQEGTNDHGSAHGDSYADFIKDRLKNRQFYAVKKCNPAAHTI